MSNTTISPNMNLIVPVVGTDPGPDWANNINASLGIIDSHNHTPGQGVQIPPAGLNINSDLSFNGNNGTQFRSVRFTSQAAPLALAADLGCLYESGVDLWYNDGSGNQVRITQSGSVTGSAGTITGLPSGTASASYSAGTFTFQSATNTPANMAVGPLIIGRNVASSKTVTITPNASQAANYALTLPLALPSVTSFIQSDASGNLSFGDLGFGLLPLGSVIGTFPSLSGAYATTATTVADSNGFVLCQGQTISDATSPMNGATVPNINNSIFLRGSMTDSSSGGSATSTALLAHTHTFTSSTSVAAASHTHGFQHTHQWGYQDSSNQLWGIDSPSVAYATAGFTTVNQLNNTLGGIAGGGAGSASKFNNGTTFWYTSYALDNFAGANNITSIESADTTVSGTTNSTGSGSSFSILPPYITTVYLMRIK